MRFNRRLYERPSASYGQTEIISPSDLSSHTHRKKGQSRVARNHKSDGSATYNLFAVKTVGSIAVYDRVLVESWCEELNKDTVETATFWPHT